MLQYKTMAMPNVVYRGVKKSEFEQGLTVETANKALGPVSTMISEQAKEGWVLHSISCIPQKIARKKGLLETLLGWIPILGGFLFPRMASECYEGQDFYMYVITFAKEI